ncbi:MAG: M20/M25/M40 family metallo-hydrolase [Defluviitaleaceae bacterium]|nr:M20/M25/M40 family metallo-hydrolase [Defluviitaleaceae bacterium]
MDSLKMIQELTMAFGPSGFEDDVLEVAKKYVPAGYAARRDSLLNFYMEKEQNPALPTVVIDAHSDEIGLMVHGIKPDGTLVFTTLGGWVPAALYAQKMVVKNLAGDFVSGVIVATMPHFGGGASTNPAIENMSLDIGASSKEEVVEKFKIAPGCPVVPASAFEQRGDIMIAKAFDCRIGCAAVLGVLDKIKDLKLDVNTVGVLTSQEEVGTRGAKVAANQIKPHIAICFEGAPADDTLVAPYMVQTALGKGPMLRYVDAGMITNPRFQRHALNLAQEKNIPVQASVRTKGSTNGAAFNIAGNGVPTIVIGCPVRYAHSHNSIASMADYENAVALAVEIIKSLNADVISGF